MLEKFIIMGDIVPFNTTSFFLKRDALRWLLVGWDP